MWDTQALSKACSRAVGAGPNLPITVRTTVVIALPPGRAPSWAAYRLGSIDETVKGRDDPAERTRFTGWVESFVRGVQGRRYPCTTPSHW